MCFEFEKLSAIKNIPYLDSSFAWTTGKTILTEKDNISNFFLVPDKGEAWSWTDRDFLILEIKRIVEIKDI